MMPSTSHLRRSTPSAVNAAIHDAALAATMYLRGERPDGVINPEVLSPEVQHA